MARPSASRRPADADFERRLTAAREQAAVDPATLQRIVGEVVSSMSGDVSLADLQLYREVEALGDYIQSARREIAGVRPHDISEQHIPMATDELDAVVQATAEATGIILGAMEEIESLAAKMPKKQAARVGELVIKVYEACSFQDITGQRITKVVRALQHIEGKIEALLALFGNEIIAAHAASAPPPEACLLNGPALPSATANSQDDIDAILASFD